MLRSMKGFGDFGLQATDGEIGSVDQFYFDDLMWTMRYLVLKTHKWLPGKVVLVSPRALGQVDWEHKVINTNLYRAQIERSPDIDLHKPVSRQEEEGLAKYYGWEPYWTDRDSHLQSSKDVMGYKIAARDGDIGKVDDFIMDDSNWRIRYMIVDTNDWMPGRKVLLSLDWIDKIMAEEKQVRVDLLKSQMANSPEFDPASLVSRDYEMALYGYYQKPMYWY